MLTRIAPPITAKSDPRGRRSCRRLPRLAPWTNQRFPSNVSDNKIDRNSIPCSTLTVASGRSSRRCNKPPLAPMPPSRIATGMMAIGFCARDERDQHAG